MRDRDELFNGQAIEMIVCVRPDDERRDHQSLCAALIRVLAGLNDRNLDAISQRARDNR
jgi:hypothetical protein